MRARATQALDLLDPDLTIEEQLQRDFPGESIGVLRNLAGAFQFSGDDVDKKIRALSGGEKTLTAIALLFGIYLVKPSPFCILDEVDAPLDDANIDRYLKIIRKFAENTQFMMMGVHQTVFASAPPPHDPMVRLRFFTE